MLPIMYNQNFTDSNSLGSCNMFELSFVKVNTNHWDPCNMFKASFTRVTENASHITMANIGHDRILIELQVTAINNSR